MQVRNTRRGAQGFTLIELLVVVVVLATLMAVALPLYLGAVEQSEIGTCRSNMQTISSAEQAFRARNHPTYAYTTVISQLHPDLYATPICPRGGAYSVTISDGTERAHGGNVVAAGGIVIHCSLSDHSVFAPGFDNE